MINILIILLIIPNALVLNERPVIGILTVPSEVNDFSSKQYSSLDASYVKYIESAGALVVPIQWDWNYDELDDIFQEINGILLTGGYTNIYINETQPGFSYNKFTDTVAYLMKKAQQSNDQKKIFPILGICQGFQILNYIASQFKPILTDVRDDIQKQRVLEILEPKSFMYVDLSKLIRLYIQKYVGPLAIHHYGILQDSYNQYKSLSQYFMITAYQNDACGLTYIASVEAKNYPFYAFQFHPEFEFASLALHQNQLVQMGQHFINKFVQLSRQNENYMIDEQLYQRVIYNFNPIMTFGKIDYEESQFYVFQRKNLNETDEKLRGINFFL